MSEETIVGAAVEAPPTPDTGVAPDAPPEQAPSVEPTESVEAQPEAVELEAGGKNARRRNAAKRAQARSEKQAVERQAAESARERALGQPRDDAGRFSKEGPETGQEPVVASDTDPTTDAVDQEAAPSGAPEMVDIPLPADHPLRKNRGETHIRVPKSEEAKVRNGINAQSEAARLRAELTQLRQAQELERARQQAVADMPADLDERRKELVKQIREADGFGDELADEYMEMLESRRKLRVLEAEQAAASDQRMRVEAHQFKDAVFSKAPQLFEIWAQNNELELRLPTLLMNYTRWVDSEIQRTGQRRGLNLSEFARFAGQTYVKDPRVQGRLKTMNQQKKQTEIDRIKQQARAEFEREQAEKAKQVADRHASRPPLSSNSAVSTRPVTEPGSTARPSTGNYRRDALTRIRERFGQP